MKNQSGRSMIEMLGVLAIIGVLSLGSVAVFNAAMNRHTANNLTYDVMLMAESTVSLGPQEQMPFDASTEYNQMSSVLVAGVANVIVNDVDREICDILISKGGNGVFVLENQADGTPLADCDDDGTDIVFAFRDGHLPEAGVCNPSCEAGHICSNGQCCLTHIPEHACSIEPTEACAGVTPPAKRDGDPCGENGDGSCQNGDCIEREWECSGNWTGPNCDECNLNSSDCGTTQAVDENNCLCVCETEGLTGYYCSYSCPSATSSVSGLSKSACEACGNAVWNNGYCYGCGRSGSISFSTEAEAEACENACAGTEYERIAKGRYCYRATKACPSEMTSTSNMSKSTCDKCENAFWKDGECYDCAYEGFISFPTEEEAEECENACAGSGYERIAEGRYCYRSPSTQCPSAESIPNMTKSTCEESCWGAVWSDGYCYDCGYLYPLSFATEAEAEACANACADVYERVAVGTDCYLAETMSMCPWETEFNPIMTKSTCEESCWGAVWSDGYCYFCGYSGSISFDTKEEAEACVEACAGTGYERTAEGRYCYLATNTGCPSATSSKYMSKSVCEECDNTVWKNGTCYGCGYSSSISFDTEEEAEACVSACAERDAYGKYCSKPTCPSVTSTKSNMSKSACESCDNAFWKGGYCYGCGVSGGIPFDTEAEAEACVAACAGSGYERVAKGTSCYLSNKGCPSEMTSTSNMSKSTCDKCENTFWIKGDCYGCGYSSSISFDTETEAEECENACAGSGYEWTADGNYCYRSPTNTDCPSETTSTSNMTKSVCDNCENTFWRKGYCFGCGYSISGGIYFDKEADAEACVSACADSRYPREVDKSGDVYYCDRK